MRPGTFFDVESRSKQVRYGFSSTAFQSMGKRTVLYASHRMANARIVDFGGWDMPLHYGSQIGEHHRVRTAAGAFDVSHMQVVDVIGSDAEFYLRYLLANDVAKLSIVGKSLYTAMLNPQGGILDDLLVYRMKDGYRLVFNCARAEADLAWISEQLDQRRVQIKVRSDIAIIAIQGPESITFCSAALTPSRAELAAKLKPTNGVMADEWFIARTGYTGERGFEIMLPGPDAPDFWRALLDSGVTPAGLGARDTLRLEAGLNLYGSDMDDTVNPMESNMGWTVAIEPLSRDFIGRKALENATGQRQLVGLVMTDKGVLRAHQVVFEGDLAIGAVTSGAHSPTLGHSIALARLDMASLSGSADTLTVEIRSRRFPIQIVKPPFVRSGKQTYKSWHQDK